MALLATVSCNKSEKHLANPFFEEWNTPFATPPFDRLRSYHYEPAFERAMSLHKEEIEAIVTSTEKPTFENTVAAYDRAGRMLSSVNNIFGMLCAADTNPEMQAVEERMMPLLAAHDDAIMMNDKLFKRVREVYDTRHSRDLAPDQIRLTERLYDRFVRSGALLSEEQKQRLAEINGELSVLSVRFGNNILSENNAFQMFLSADEVSDLPSSVRDAARDAARDAGHESKFLFTLHKPSMLPFLTYSTHRDLREKLYRAYLRRCATEGEHDNRPLITEIMRLRTEKVRLLGFKSYADYVTSEQMSGSPRAVYALIDDIWQPALDKASAELADMEKLFRRDFPHHSNSFQSWDWWYYAEKLRKQRYALDEEMLRPYFSLDNVRQGVFNLANRLFAITFRPIVVPLYNDEVSAFEVIDENEKHLGVLYFDFHPRSGKSQGAWCGYYREQRYDENGVRQAPHVGIVCNFTRPSGKTPALLSLDEVTTLFHEFGHALHFLFSDVRYNGLLEVEGDFVELPSQVMENWAMEPEVLRNYAINYRTNGVITDHMISKIHRSGTFNQGFATTELLAAALTDMDIHSLVDFENFDVEAFEYDALYAKRKMLSEIEPRYHLAYFAHIFAGGYSAGYYFYIWAEVLDKDAYEAFVETGDKFDRRTADKLRALLTAAGSQDGMTLYRQFRGKDPERTPLLKARGLCEEPKAESVVELPKDDAVLTELRRVNERANEEDAREVEQLAADAEAVANENNVETNKK